LPLLEIERDRSNQSPAARRGRDTLRPIASDLSEIVNANAMLQTPNVRCRRMNGVLHYPGTTPNNVTFERGLHVTASRNATTHGTV
jgi:hypothetical protein